VRWFEFCSAVAAVVASTINAPHMAARMGTPVCFVACPISINAARTSASISAIVS
jgi:hypothetical protein